jgi:hypothetical protein
MLFSRRRHSISRESSPSLQLTGYAQWRVLYLRVYLSIVLLRNRSLLFEIITNHTASRKNKQRNAKLVDLLSVELLNASQHLKLWSGLLQ